VATAILVAIVHATCW